MDDIDCLLNPEAVCPFCGHVHTDSWEIGGGEEGDHEFQCESCDAEMIVSRVVDVSYTTMPNKRKD